MGAPRVPPLNPSESIVLSKHYRLPLCRETQSLGQQMLNAPFGIHGLTEDASCSSARLLTFPSQPSVEIQVWAFIFFLGGGDREFRGYSVPRTLVSAVFQVSGLFLCCGSFRYYQNLSKKDRYTFDWNFSKLLLFHEYIDNE